MDFPLANLPCEDNSTNHTNTLLCGTTESEAADKEKQNFL